MKRRYFDDYNDAARFAQWENFDETVGFDQMRMQYFVDYVE